MMFIHSSITISLSVIILTGLVFSIHVERRRSGDIFEAACNECHLYNAQCTDKHFHLFQCCYECTCEFGATLYGDMCRTNIPQEQLQCKVFAESEEYYGLKTHAITGKRTYIGYLKDKWYWNRKVFYKCSIDDESTYWDTKRWRKLFSDGRLITDFIFDGTSDGVKLTMSFDDNRWQLYVGLLIKFSITCHSYHEIPHYGALNLGERLLHHLFPSKKRSDYTVSSCLVLKFAGKRSYYESTVSPITKKPTIMTDKSTLQKTTAPISTIPVTFQKISSDHSETVTTEKRKDYNKTDVVPATVLISSIKPEGKDHSTKEATVHPITTAGKITGGDNTITTTKIVTASIISAKKIIVQTTPPVHVVYYRKTFEVMTPIICVGIFFIFFCVVFVWCYKRNYHWSPASGTLLRNYGSIDSTESLLSSNEYAIISTPTYPDVKELENWEKKKNHGADYGKTKPYSSKGDNPNLPSSIIAQESIDGEQRAREDWDGTLYMRTDNLFRL